MDTSQLRASAELGEVTDNRRVLNQVAGDVQDERGHLHSELQSSQSQIHKLRNDMELKNLNERLKGEVDNGNNALEELESRDSQIE